MIVCKQENQVIFTSFICLNLHPEEEHSIFLRNTGILPRHCTFSFPRIPQPESLSPLKSRMFLRFFNDAVSIAEVM